MHTMAYPSVFKGRKASYAKIWMKLESIMSNETPEKDYDSLYMKYIDAQSSQQFTDKAQHMGSSL